MANLIITCSYYTPAYLAGGPIKTISGFVESFHLDYNISILTRDRDISDRQPFKNIKRNTWHNLDNCSCLYLTENIFSYFSIIRVLRETPYDAVYLNSLFDPLFSIWIILLMNMKLIPRKPILIAPRGELSRGALSIKSMKKKAFLHISYILNLYRNAILHASSKKEENDITLAFKMISDNKLLNRIVVFFRLKLQDYNIFIAPDIIVAPNLATKYLHTKYKQKEISEFTRIIFLSRISNMKNLDYALNVLSSCNSKIIFDIYGPLEKDNSYWNKCILLIESLPKNILAIYHGPVRPSEVRNIISHYDLFFLPTKGENFGHVIIEALSAGCPVLISDQTPWADIQDKNVGWIVPLSAPKDFMAIIDNYSTLTQQERNILANNCILYIDEYFSSNEVFQLNSMLLKSLFKTNANCETIIFEKYAS